MRSSPPTSGFHGRIGVEARTPTRGGLSWPVAHGDLRDSRGPTASPVSTLWWQHRPDPSGRRRTGFQSVNYGEKTAEVRWGRARRAGPGGRQFPSPGMALWELSWFAVSPRAGLAGPPSEDSVAL